MKYLKKIKNFISLEAFLAIYLMITSAFSQDITLIRVIGFVGWFYVLVVVIVIGILSKKAEK